MHPYDCPEWEYNAHPMSAAVLKDKTRQLLRSLRLGSNTASAIASDTRQSHHFCFKDLTPEGHPYFAGNYRGSLNRCLEYLSVGVGTPGGGTDPNVGVPPALVSQRMSHFHNELGRGIRALDQAHKVPHSQVSRELKLYYTVCFASRAFVEFLTIHPFANGNGHMARLIVLAILGHYGFWPKRWPVEPRPSGPEYIEAIQAYRKGNRNRMEQFILGCILAR